MASFEEDSGPDEEPPKSQPANSEHASNACETATRDFLNGTMEAAGNRECKVTDFIVVP
jgi:hypothetical protein